MKILIGIIIGFLAFPVLILLFEFIGHQYGIWDFAPDER